MDRIRRLHNPVQEYAWGSRRLLAELRGAAPSERPEAELWIGAHPKAPSTVALEESSDARTMPLDEWIARDTEAALGGGARERFGESLPFLLKIIAPERALSIQTHPGADDAREGFARENAAGIPLTAAARNYRDPNPKPELICALTPFRTLCGLRPRERAAQWIEELAGSPSTDAESARTLGDWAALLRSGEDDAYARFLAAALGADAEGRAAVAAATERAARTQLAAAPGDDAERQRAFALVGELAAQYPRDIGVLAPLFLHAIDLAPGEALFLEAGTLHAYLGGGLAVEVMANSDNVLRCGLTPKHIDVQELLRVLDPREDPVARCEPQPEAAGSGALSEYRANTPFFRLARLELASGESRKLPAPEDPTLWLCTEGAAELHGAAGERVALRAAEAAWLPAAAGAYCLEATETATLYRASLPDARVGRGR